MTGAERQAPPVGRGLRFVLGVLLLVDVLPAYLEVGRGAALAGLLVVVLLIGVYGAWQYLVNRLPPMNPWLGALLAVGLLVVVVVLGAPGGVLLGRGEGELGVVTFLAASLIAAAVRGDPGCEVLAIPGLLFRKRAQLRCLLFSVTDRIEDRLWKRHAAD